MENPAVVKAILAAVVCGLFVCVAYPLLIFAPLPGLALIVLAAFMGPALGVACFGLHHLLMLDAPRISSRLGMILNFIAGALFCAMALVQLAVRQSGGGDRVPRQLVGVWLGLDVAWDVYIGLGTFCFALAMLRHPRYGRWFALSGLVIATAMMAFNLYTFPDPPADAGLVDLGPAVGLWYLAVMVQAWRSLSWARSYASSGESRTPVS